MLDSFDCCLTREVFLCCNVVAESNDFFRRIEGHGDVDRLSFGLTSAGISPSTETNVVDCWRGVGEFTMINPGL